jgi:hypothetical protein
MRRHGKTHASAEIFSESGGIVKKDEFATDKHG